MVYFLKDLSKKDAVKALKLRGAKSAQGHALALQGHGKRACTVVEAPTEAEDL